MNEMKERFERIYAKNEWKKGYGEGSLPINNRTYIKMLENFIREKSIDSIVDLGCGDWQFSKYIDWGKSHYMGFDIVSSVIKKNQELFSTPKIEFQLYSGDLNELPTADLLILKDVLQHWSNKAIFDFLPTLNQYKYSIITNCVNPSGETLNNDIEDGSFRYLDIKKPPFSLNAFLLLEYKQHRNFIKVLLRRPQWLKRVLLINNDGSS